jgi:SDR family mycofactocin-dependent oxidoreductase
VVVAAAGVIAGGDVAWKTSDDVWSANLEVNLTGVWRTARATVPALLARPEPRSGRFVAIASAAGLGGHPRLSAYVAAKHGVIGLVRSLAVELGQLGITANAVCPGSTATRILEASAEVYHLEGTDEFAVHHPIGRLLEPDEIASAVAWLCGPDQSAVTGVALPVDGGMTV